MDHCLGIPEDAIVSVRCGGMRRQAPLETLTTQPLKFPVAIDAVSEPLKIDVLQPVATTRLVLHPHEELYSIGFEHSAEMVIGLKMKSQNDLPVEGNGPENAAPNFRDAAASAKDYLEQHGLLRYVQSMLHAVIQVRPGDPYAYMIEQLSAAQSKTRTLERIVSRPSSALDRARTPGASPVTPVPPREPPPSCSPTRPRPPSSELLHVRPKTSSEPSESTRIPEGTPGSTPLPALAESEGSPAEPLEELRLLLKSKLQDAYNSGTLEDVVAQAVGPPPEATSSPPAPRSAGEAKKDCATRGSANAKDLDAGISLKADLKLALFDALDSGDLQDALSDMSTNKLETEKTLKISEDLDVVSAIKVKLREHLCEASESGALGPALQSLARPEPAVPQAHESHSNAPESVQDLREKMRELLQDSVTTGSLQEALDQLSLTKNTQNEPFMESKGKAGKKEKAGRAAASESCDRLLSLKAAMLERAEAALDSGELESVLSSMERDAKPAKPLKPPEGPPPPEAEAEDLAAIKKKLRGLLEDAAESGKLQGTLQRIEMAPEGLDLKSLHAELTTMKQQKNALSQTVNQLTAEMDAPSSVPAFGVGASPGQPCQQTKNGSHRTSSQLAPSAPAASGLVGVA